MGSYFFRNRRIVLVWTALFLVGILMGGAIYTAYSRQLQDNLNNIMERNIRFAETSYGIYMGQMRMGMLQASSEACLQERLAAGDADALQRTLEGWAVHRSYVDEWYVVDKDGRIMAEHVKGTRTLRSADKLILHDMIRNVLEQKQAVMGTHLLAQKNQAREQLVQYAAVPVGSGSSAAGAIVTAISLDGDTIILNKIMEETGMRGIITAGDTIISSNVAAEEDSFRIGGKLEEPIARKVLQEGGIYIGRMNSGIQGGLMYEHFLYCAFRPIKDMSGQVIGAQGILYHDQLADSSANQLKNFSIIIILLLSAVFSILAWSYQRTDRILQKEKQHTKRLGDLKKFSDMVRQAITEDEVYELLFDILRAKEHIRQVIIVQKDYTDKNLKMYKALKDDGTAIDRFIRTPEEACWAIRSGKEFIMNDKDRDFNCRDFHSEAASHMCIPVVVGGYVSAIIQIQSDVKNFFTDEMVSELKLYVDTITPVISNLRLLESLNTMASTDTLTKMFNRRFLDDYLEKQINQAKRNNQYLSIVMIDIDHFKRFNDTYGHEAGDYVLMRFAETIKSYTRESDVAARYGGEEFIMVLPQTDVDAAFTAAEKLRMAVEKISLTAINESDPPRITCSLGISCYPLHGSDMEKLIQSADKALYQAKNTGRNRTCIFGKKE